MSLLSGIVHRDPRRPAEPERLERLACAHDGPRTAVAASGCFAVMLSGGCRPWSRDGSPVVAVDADLVNLDELSALTGHQDVQEVVAALYQREGIGGIQRLLCAFALVIWEPQDRQLLLAVDQVGMRRLYYAVTGDCITFASRAGVLRALGEVRGDPEPTAIYHYLNFGYLPAPTSVCREIRRLEPGCLLKARDGIVATTRYWDLNYSKRGLDEDATARATMRQAEAAVARALGSSGAKDTGAFLSGGTDSSTVLGLMSRLTWERVHALSIGFHVRRRSQCSAGIDASASPPARGWSTRRGSGSSPASSTATSTSSSRGGSTRVPTGSTCASTGRTPRRSRRSRRISTTPSPDTSAAASPRRRGIRVPGRG